ncbi:YeeE/YedE family protein [Candidatus Halobonum tyrrellensis]|uniref:Transporter component n=1 Tax=Candidatus Halobonum tyrrellensis G22 TaxID=1324957 RepID=V4HK12_9EURY|nr:YeeE/YedE thiosulfate transporter family protein [Candidatus Halobonum tyrrellensis]ESP90123.1 transporter component [Candidatus Halobonum tyrrellensis G22]
MTEPSTLIQLAALGDLFPRGVLPYLVGGLLVGAGAAVIYLATGIIAGASTFLESTLSYVSDVPRFNRLKYVSSRGWRVVFTVGIVSGAALYAFVLNPSSWSVAAPTDVQWWRLLGGGFLVGVGTRLGKGCTSGHGVCGMGSLSNTSFVNVATFLAVAVGTAQLVAAVGVAP